MKNTARKTLTLRISDEMYEKAVKISQKSGTSVNSVITLAATIGFNVINDPLNPDYQEYNLYPLE